jgi:hypothetical protein
VEGEVIDHSQSAHPKPTRKRKKSHSIRNKRRTKRGMVIDLDRVARAEIIEDRDRNICQRCGDFAGKVGTEWAGRFEREFVVVIQWAHVHTREYYITRWEPDNSLALCSRCHVWFDNHKVLSLDWFAKKFPERWERIKRILQGNCKTTDADVRQMWKERCGGSHGGG